jgi:3-isopropylmalate/(R)-2-methylmalate dehydratase large subunit
MTLTNMAIEAGGKNGVCDVDEKTLAYVRARSNRAELGSLHRRRDASIYEHEWDLATMEPMVAKPHSPDNKDTAHNCRDVKLDRAYIGSCTGGKITDMIFAANILKGTRSRSPRSSSPAAPKCTPTCSSSTSAACRERPQREEHRGHPARRRLQVGPSGCAACLGGPATRSAAEQHR